MLTWPNASTRQDRQPTVFEDRGPRGPSHRQEPIMVDVAGAALTHVARQPIVDARNRLVGYELLFRNGSTATAANASGDEATTSTILAAFGDFDPGELLAGRQGFVNLTRAFLTGRLPVPFSPEVAVLEVLETVEIDDEVVAGVTRLASEGFTIALDDFVWSRAAEPLLELADVVKVDVLEQDWAAVLETVERCRSWQVRLLAERVEDEEVLRRCHEAGFELFQGYHLGRPQTMTTATLTPSHARALELLTQLSRPETTAADVEAVLKADPALAYRLLKIANASTNGLRRPVATVRDAVVVIGLAKLRSWLVLLVLSGLGNPAVLTHALLRARSCELLAHTSAAGAEDTAFALGLLDGVAEVLGMSGDELTTVLPPLAPELAAGLRGEQTTLGDVLRAVRRYESGEEVEQPGVVDAYLSALAWTGQASASIESADSA
jgi:EAL and modified HD-GYP domain-containing signal transduction protein